MSQFIGTYKGIVVQNNDPTQSGRVKVFVPGANITQLQGWNQETEENKYFKVPGSNTGSSLDKFAMDQIKTKAIWAEVVFPVMGSGAPGRYDAANDSYSIANDSDFKFQDVNKTADAYRDDAYETYIRRKKVLNLLEIAGNCVFGPEIRMNLDFMNNGFKFCTNLSCPSVTYVPPIVDTIESIWKSGSPGLECVIDRLPKEYKRECTILDPKDDSIENLAISNITLEVTDPEIYLNDVLIPKDSPIYNRTCPVPPPEKRDLTDIYVPSGISDTPSFALSDVIFCDNAETDSDEITSFAPPILFESSNDPITEKYCVDLLVDIVVNGNSSPLERFALYSYSSKQVVYRRGELKVVIPTNNLESTKIKHNSRFFDLNKLYPIIPFLLQAPTEYLLNGVQALLAGPVNLISNTVENLLNKMKNQLSGFLNAAACATGMNFNFNLVMPRLPYPKGRKKFFRSGCGGEIFDFVLSQLLPECLLKDTHLGGANNESRYNINRGREPLNDPNNVRGANIVSPLHQLHRGPLRTTSYGNEHKGIVSTLAPGAHVSVQFRNGDPNYPVITGVMTSGTAFRGITKTQPTPFSGPQKMLPGGGVAAPGKITNFGYEKETDEDWDPLSAKRIAAITPDYVEKKLKAGFNPDNLTDNEKATILREGDLAVSRDIQKQFIESKINFGDTVLLHYADGRTSQHIWKDVTAEKDPETGGPLTGRYDIYTPNRLNDKSNVYAFNDGARIVGFSKVNP